MDIKILKRDMEIERGGSRIRETTRRIHIRGDYDGREDIVIYRKRGGFEIKWCGHLDDDARRDLDYTGRFFVWNYCNFTLKDALKLARWLETMAGTRIKRQKRSQRRE